MLCSPFSPQVGDISSSRLGGSRVGPLPDDGARGFDGLVSSQVASAACAYSSVQTACNYRLRSMCPSNQDAYSLNIGQVLFQILFSSVQENENDRRSRVVHVTRITYLCRNSETWSGISYGDRLSVTGSKRRWSSTSVPLLSKRSPIILPYQEHYVGLIKEGPCKSSSTFISIIPIASPGLISATQSINLQHKHSRYSIHRYTHDII